MSKNSGKAFDFKLFGRVMQYVRPYRTTFRMTAFFIILLAVITPLRPFLIMEMINKFVSNVDTFTVLEAKQGLLVYSGIILFIIIIEAVFQFLYTYYSNWLGQSITIDIRSKLYAHVTKFKLTYFDKTPIGQLVTRVISDIETIASIFSDGLLNIIGDILKLVVLIGVMFWVDWRLTLYSLASIPILFVGTYIFKNAIKKAFNQVRNQVSKLNTFAQEHITGINIVQIFNREKAEMKKFKAINEEHKKAHIKSIWAFSIFFPFVELCSALSMTFLIWFGAGDALEGILNPTTDIETKQEIFGTLFFFILNIQMIFRPIRQLADRFNVLQMGMLGAERVFKVLDKDEKIKNEGTIEEFSSRGSISFQNVWFAYQDDNFVLKDISFNLKHGETIAFVGATGAGKTSVVNLLGRFYEYQQGNILIDNKNLRDYKLSVLRKNIAVVLQDVFLFSDSVFNNITLKDPSISREKVIEAAKAVGVHDFIMKLPNGYDYNVQERGGMLSVGQRQLLAFIRAYVYNPKILVLDEATSSVDSESEELIEKAIEKLTQQRTSIIIAHRLSTIQRADKIIVLDKGEIIEVGDHQELLKQNGQYKKLYYLQFENS